MLRLVVSFEICLQKSSNRSTTYETYCLLIMLDKEVILRSVIIKRSFSLIRPFNFFLVARNSCWVNRAKIMIRKITLTVYTIAKFLIIFKPLEKFDWGQCQQKYPRILTRTQKIRFSPVNHSFHQIVRPPYKYEI